MNESTSRLADMLFDEMTDSIHDCACDEIPITVNGDGYIDEYELTDLDTYKAMLMSMIKMRIERYLK